MLRCFENGLNGGDSKIGRFINAISKEVRDAIVLIVCSTDVMRVVSIQEARRT